MKSIIYVDGYNLFYDCLKHSRDKWLDIRKVHLPELSQYADRTRKHITDSELSRSHLPAKIPTQKKPIIKPEYW